MKIIVILVILFFILWFINKNFAKSLALTDTQSAELEYQVILETLEKQKTLTYATSQDIEAKQNKKVVYHFIKRLVDIIGALCGLIILSPIFLVLCFLVKWEDGGNIFYGHVRIGYHGKKIKVFKFRSMKMRVENLEKLLTPQQLEQYKREFKIDNDPRITKIGNVLRKLSLDELPQLINILIGDISIVGPRPIVEKETLIYGEDVNKLLSVKPGLTGYWQAYARNNATYESGERQKMEMFYVENCSLWMDIKILFKTVISVIKKEGAQ